MNTFKQVAIKVLKIDKTIDQAKDELEIQLVSPNKLSEEDIKF